MEISKSVSVMGCLIGSIGEESVNGIKTICCTGDAGGFCRGEVSSWSSLGVVLLTDMWVPLWVAGVGSVLPLGQKYKV